VSRFYLTTAIDYVNSRPHLGTAYEKVATDVIARYKRLCGIDTHFLMGNDEHSQNVFKKAVEQGLDLLLVNHLVNVRYLTGFTGTNGAFVLGPEHRVFLTDFRYVERAKREVPDFDRVRGRDDLLEAVAEIATGVGGRLGFDDAHMTVRAHAKLAEKLGEGVELVPAGGLVEELRAIKDDEETTAIQRAAGLADEVYRWLIDEHGLTGHTERAVALALERRAAPRDPSPRCGDPARHAGGGRLRLHPRLLLLRLHPDLRDGRCRPGGAGRL